MKIAFLTIAFFMGIGIGVLTRNYASKIIQIVLLICSAISFVYVYQNYYVDTFLTTSAESFVAFAIGFRFAQRNILKLNK